MHTGDSLCKKKKGLNRLQVNGGVLLSKDKGKIALLYLDIVFGLHANHFKAKPKLIETFFKTLPL